MMPSHMERLGFVFRRTLSPTSTPASAASLSEPPGGGGSPLGVPAVRGEARGVRNPRRQLQRRHGHGGAMAAALVGAIYGSSWIPARWHDNIENGADGQDEIVALAR